MTTANATTRMPRKDSAKGQPRSGVQAKSLPNSNDPIGCAQERLLLQWESSSGTCYPAFGGCVWRQGRTSAAAPLCGSTVGLQPHLLL